MGNDNLESMIPRQRESTSFSLLPSIHILNKDMHGACTTISVYENLSKNSFFFCVGKPTPPVCRSCSRFASAKVRLFYKPAKDWKRFFKKNTKKGCRMDNK